MSSVSPSVEEKATAGSPRVKDEATSTKVNRSNRDKDVIKSKTAMPPARTEVEPKQPKELPVKSEGHEVEKESPVKSEGQEVKKESPVKSEGQEVENELPVNSEGQDIDLDSIEPFEEIDAPPNHPLEDEDWEEVNPEEDPEAEEGPIIQSTSVTLGEYLAAGG